MPDSYSRGYIAGNVFVDLTDLSDGQVLEYSETAGAIIPKTHTTLDFPVNSKEVVFTEAATAVGTTYTGDVALPAGSTLLDIVVYAEALWTDTTSAGLDVGDFTAAGVEIDANGFYAAVDLKATDLTADQSLSFAQAGGVGGAYFTGTNTHVDARYSADARLIRGVVVANDGDGDAGVTRMTVVYSLPGASSAATSAAT